MSSLWQLGADASALYSEIELLLTQNGGNVNDPLVQEKIEAFFANEDALLEKLDGYAALIRDRRARHESLTTEAALLSKQAKTAKHLADRLENRLEEYLKARGLEKLETKRYRLSMVGNGGVAPLVFADNFDARTLPPELIKVEPDNTAIRKLLDAGKPVLGVKIGERGKHLSYG